MVAETLTELSIVVAIGTAISIVMKLIKQPLIIGYIITGLIVGPTLFNIVQDSDTIELFSKIGIALLLIVIGLGLNPKVIKEVGRVSALTGIGQVVFTTVIGFILIRLLGYGSVEAIYIAIALTFSSTIIVLKLLSDKKEQNRLYGKISIGFLLVQDIIAMFALMFAAALGANDNVSLFSIFRVLFYGIGIGALVVAASAFLLPHINRVIGSSQELLFLFAISWGLGTAMLFAKAGLSLEVGALIAGISLAPMPYAQEVSAKLRPLRDFFIIMFFIILGMQLSLENSYSILFQAIILSIFILIGNPLIVMVIMGIMGFTKQTGFKAGLTVAQISEFSLLFIALGFNNQQVSESTISLVTLVGIITIALSSYMIIYSDQIYLRIYRLLSVFERKDVIASEKHNKQYDAILFGYKKGGAEFIKVLEQMKKHFVVVDYDPEVVDTVTNRDIHFVYGDATDLELLGEIGLNKAKFVVSTISDNNTNVFLAKWLEKSNPQAVFVCAADDSKQASELYEEGASYVMMPHYIGSEKISSFIKRNGFNKGEFKHFREKHLLYLQTHYE